MNVIDECSEALSLLYEIQFILGLEATVDDRARIIPTIQQLKAENADLKIALSKDAEGSEKYEAIMIIKNAARLWTSGCMERSADSTQCCNISLKIF